MNENDRVSYIAVTNFWNQRKRFGIRRPDRRFHTYIIGKTGTGKSTLLGNLVRQDIQNGEGLTLLDPHGDLVESIVAEAPAHRSSDVVYFDVPNPGSPLTFNPLDGVPPAKRSLAASGLLEVFKKIWTNAWGPRLEHILRNTLLALLDQPEAILADVLRMFEDGSSRRSAVARVENAQVKRFWVEEFERYTPGVRGQAIGPIQNTVGAFLSDPILNRILSGPKSSFDLRRVIDDGKILLVNLAKGKIGESAAALLGSMLVSQFRVAGLGRADMPEPERHDFYLYLDEFQTFTTTSLAGMLSELRKYRLSLILTNQYLALVHPDVAESILGNVGTLISFRRGPKDAQALAKEFSPQFDPRDLLNLPNHSIYLKLMIDGAVSKPFSADTEIQTI